jgi:predicted ATPase
MHLKSLAIKNFRGLENIQVDLEQGINVIVGPNAIGKTTLLEAIRLNKAMLAPRTAAEPTQCLTSLGAIVPYDPSQLLFDALARDTNQTIEIKCKYQLTEEELDRMRKHIPEIAVALVQASIGQNFANPAQIATYLSSAQGLSAFNKTQNDLEQLINDLHKTDRICRLELLVDGVSGRFTNSYPIETTLLAFLDRTLSPSQTCFSYFPADRALPIGEQPVQIGGGDTNSQVESYSSQPQLKYARLKNTIFNAIITSEEEKALLKEDFAHIFARVLKGRKLIGVGVNKYGLLSVGIQDTDSGRTFNLDGMSSGEKGLILTFLIMSRTLADGAIILLDEPELHLNPAVCKDILGFLLDRYVRPKNLQAIICSHSAEILAGAFDKEGCTLFHLISEKNLTRVRYKDREVIAEALRALGTSETEGLLYKGTIFVEGKDDVEILEAGYSDLLRRYIVRDRYGRQEIEKQIRLLQEAERKGDNHSPSCFIFDRDEHPSELKSSAMVKILQWDRHCLENYLIDIDVLTDLLTNKEVVQRPLPNQGEVSNLLRSLAMAQLDEFVAKEIYDSYRWENAGLRADEIRGKNLTEIATILNRRLHKAKLQFDSLEDDWPSAFVQKCEARKKELQPVWESKWQLDCDGKRLFSSLQTAVSPRMPLLKFKRLVTAEMRNQARENWSSVEALLKKLLA